MSLITNSSFSRVEWAIEWKHASVSRSSASASAAQGNWGTRVLIIFNGFDHFRFSLEVAVLDFNYCSPLKNHDFAFYVYISLCNLYCFNNNTWKVLWNNYMFTITKYGEKVLCWNNDIRDKYTNTKTTKLPPKKHKHLNSVVFLSNWISMLLWGWLWRKK